MRLQLAFINAKNWFRQYDLFPLLGSILAAPYFEVSAGASG